MGCIYSVVRKMNNDEHKHMTEISELDIICKRLINKCIDQNNIVLANVISIVNMDMNTYEVIERELDANAKLKVPIIDLKTVRIDDTILPTYDFTHAKVLEVYDGDTYTIAAEYHGKITRFKTRLYGVNTAEMKSHDIDERANALAAKTFVESLILGNVVRIRVLNNKMRPDECIEYTPTGKIKKPSLCDEKFGRLLSLIYVDDRLLSDIMIEHGHGKSYFGSGEKKW